MRIYTQAHNTHLIFSIHQERQTRLSIKQQKVGEKYLGPSSNNSLLLSLLAGFQVLQSLERSHSLRNTEMFWIHFFFWERWSWFSFLFLCFSPFFCCFIFIFPIFLFSFSHLIFYSLLPKSCNFLLYFNWILSTHILLL